MKKILIISILPLMLSLTFTSPGIASALETTALVPHVEILTPGVTRTIIVTQYRRLSPRILVRLLYSSSVMAHSK